MRIIKQWWLTLTQHEQVTLLLGTSLLIMLTVYFAVWKPLAGTTVTLTNKVNAQEKLYTWIQKQQTDIGQLLLLQPRQHQSDESLFSIIEQSLQDNNLYAAANQMTANDPDNITIQFKQTSFDEFIRWITLLEQQHNITVTQTTINRIADAAGEVQVTISLTRIQV